MASTKTVTYDIRDLNGIIIPNKSIKVNIETSDNNPKYLIHKTLIIKDSLKRQGTVSCKTRSEVRGGGKKPWKQKGTGRARSGSSNSPLWKGGGVAFGPRPKNTTKKINQKERRLALMTALCKCSNKILVIENNFNFLNKPSTKEISLQINKINPDIQNSKCLVILHEINENLMLSMRNLNYVDLISHKKLNLRQLLIAKTIIITEKALLNITTL